MLSLALFSVLLATISPALPAWESPLPGLAYRAFSFQPEREPGDFFAPDVVRVHAFRFSPTRYEMRVLAGEVGRGCTVDELAKKHAAPLLTNGGFFLEDFTPLGLLVSEGRELNALRRVDWGVFSVAGGRARLVHRKDWTAPRDLEFAVESGPRLVVDGAPLRLKPQRARRTALGIDAEGRILVFATEDPVYTSQLARFLARPESEGGPGCRHALNLDGGSSTQLRFEGGGRRVRIPSTARVANVIGVFPRK